MVAHRSRRAHRRGAAPPARLGERRRRRDQPAGATEPCGRGAATGYEAAQVIVQAAVDCSDGGQDVAVRAWPFHAPSWTAATWWRRPPLDGQALAGEQHPLALVAAAAAAAASGEHSRAAELLDSAGALDEQAPSYFGAAWIALGRLWLDTDLLGGCRPSAPPRP